MCSESKRDFQNDYKSLILAVSWRKKGTQYGINMFSSAKRSVSSYLTEAPRQIQTHWSALSETYRKTAKITFICGSSKFRALDVYMG